MTRFYTEEQIYLEWLCYHLDGGEMAFEHYRTFNPIVTAESRLAA